jgi:hypothetical protein
MAKIWKFTAGVNVHITVPEDTQRKYRALNKLVENKALISRIVVEAMYRSLLVAYRTRFNINTPFTEQNMGGRSKNAINNRLVWDKINRLRKEYDQLMKDGHKALANDKAEEIAKAQDLFKVRSGGGAKYNAFLDAIMYRSGGMRTAMNTGMKEILSMIAQKHMITRFSTTPLRFGIGNIHGLDSVKTPSYANTIMGGKHSKSPFKILWRQIEFGTGALADKRFKQTTGTTKVGNAGDWRYGPTSKVGTIIHGSRGMHVFRNDAGLAYTEDASKFGSMLRDNLTKALQGLEE